MFPAWYIPPHKRKAHKHPAQNYAKAVAKHFDIPLSKLRGPCKKAPTSLARHFQWYCIRKGRPDLSLPVIARLTNRKDHTTVLHGVRRVEGMLLRDPSWQAVVDEIDYNARVMEWDV